MAKKPYKVVVDPDDPAMFRVKDMETGEHLAPAVSSYAKALEILEAVKFDERMDAEHGAGMHEEHSVAGCRLCNEPVAEELDPPPDPLTQEELDRITEPEAAQRVSPYRE